VKGMLRREKSVILVNKPKGITSLECVIRVKNKVNAKKAGHCGTLDVV